MQIAVCSVVVEVVTSLAKISQGFGHAQETLLLGKQPVL